jgi:hypothetical protein
MATKNGWTYLPELEHNLISFLGPQWYREPPITTPSGKSKVTFPVDTPAFAETIAILQQAYGK